MCGLCSSGSGSRFYLATSESFVLLDERRVKSKKSRYCVKKWSHCLTNLPAGIQAAKRGSSEFVCAYSREGEVRLVCNDWKDCHRVPLTRGRFADVPARSFMASRLSTGSPICHHTLGLPWTGLDVLCDDSDQRQVNE